MGYSKLSWLRFYISKERINLAAAKVPDDISNELTNAIKKAIALSYIDSFRLIMFIAAALSVASAVVAFLMINHRKKFL